MNILNLNALKRMVTLTTVCGALLCCMGMTPQERAYRDSACKFIKFNDNGSRYFECCGTNPGTEVLKMYSSEWDTGEPIPEPEPPPPDTGCIANDCWVSVQDCSIETPLIGKDNCGGTCVKPSKEYPNCIHPDGSIGPKIGL